MTKEEYNEALSKGERMSRPMIVIEDRETGAIVAHMCSQKGPGDKWIVRRIGKDLKEMGYGGTRIILKCDQENPIAAVQQEVIKNRPDVATVPRHNPVGESQSNGRVEPTGGVKTTLQMTRFRDAKVCNNLATDEIDDHRIQSDYKCISGLQNPEGKNSTLGIVSAW